MARPDRPIFLTSDLDGVQFHAPIPRGTAWNLLRGKFNYPTEDQELEEYEALTGIIGVAILAINRKLHEVRKRDEIGYQSLAAFKQAAALHDRIIQFAALTGREPPMHPLTMQKIIEYGLMEHFTQLYFNTTKSSSGFKRKTIHGLLTEDPEVVVVHLEDDLKPALSISDLDRKRTLVYLKKNKSNHPFLLKRGGVVIPSNVKLVDNFMVAATDFEERLSTGSI